MTRDHRDKVVSLRLTQAEHDALTDRANSAGKNLSDYIRDVLLSKPLVPFVAPIYGGSVTTSAPKCTVLWNAPVRQDGDTGYITAAWA